MPSTRYFTIYCSCSWECRKFSSGQLAVEQWLTHLKENDLPVLVCLTHADRLYSECVGDDHTLEPTKYKQKIMEKDLSVSSYWKKNQLFYIAGSLTCHVHSM